ncbi:hypothetical protein CBM2626_B140137 [Cupriavidus taiwanensis]|nr:hypothetical protein CBM2626_B140137 [Cupriavidus taiwanensis]
MTRTRQGHAVALPTKQLDAEIRFKDRDLPANRGLGNVQFLGRERQVLRSGRDLEDPQWIHRRNASRHVHKAVRNDF